ncbi:Parkin co-regulated protein [Cinara cedri]|uniref:Parkin co-regulated protein n=1 Tax=Cinara cedri TaxID=506608 RepID=A0A5E4NFE0_9HEMI|nr:Parkin co-regulated protein [Cinara cedri]
MNPNDDNKGPSGKRCKTKNLPKTVPGFCMQAYQKNTVTEGPKTAENVQPKTVKATTNFAAKCGRPGFPLAASYAGRNRPFRWLVPLEMIDYDVYLPIMTDGLREPSKPYGACAAQGLWDLLTRDTTSRRVLNALPRMVFPLRRALNAAASDHWRVGVRALKTLQKLASAGKDGRVGYALVPYYRLLLPPLNRYGRLTDVSSNDGVNQCIKYNIADLCYQTLLLLEYTGGQCAYSNIKYLIPTYENVVVCCKKPARTGTATDTSDGTTALHIK